MKNRRSFYIMLSLLGVAVVILILALRSCRSEPQLSEDRAPKVAQSITSSEGINDPEASPTKSSADSRAQMDKVVGKTFLEAFTTPILFFGKVVDETGKPVSRASVKLMAADKPWGESSVYNQESDDQGLFSLTGARGAGLAIDISKAGFYSTAAARGRFVYGGIRGTGDPVNPTSDKPAIFVLRKMGETEPLFASDRDVVAPKNGQPVEISLRTGRAVSKGEGDIAVECWTNNEGLDPNKNEHYDWRMRLTVPNGGLIERVGEFSFIAPESGYRSNEEISMSKDVDNWRSSFQREYFIKTGGGSFARMNFQMTAGGGHFVTIKALFNPKSGSRNLEFDPAKVITPPR